MWQKILIIIISIFAVLYIFLDNKPKTNKKTSAEIFYIEKATGIKAFKFNNQHKLVQKTTAQAWVKYNNNDNLITKPKIITLTNNIDNQIDANFAKVITKNIIEFQKDVQIIGKNNQLHKLNTQSLIANTAQNYYYSTENIKYFIGSKTITAEGVKIFATKQLVKFRGKTTILDNANHNKIISKNVVIDNSKQNKIYSKQQSNFITTNLNASSNSGFILENKTTTLLGNVILTQGTTTLACQNLNITGGEYQAKNGIYKQIATKIKANDFYYNNKTQIIKLSGNVIANYKL